MAMATLIGDDGSELTMTLEFDADERWRWYANGEDTETSATTRDEAIGAAGVAWYGWEWTWASEAEMAWSAIEQRSFEQLQGMMEPVLIRFTDTNYPTMGEMQVVPRPHLSDISWSERGRDYEILLELDSAVLEELYEAYEAGCQIALLEGWLA